MPISRTQFKSGKINRSQEEIVCDTLGYGNGYSLDELEQKVEIPTYSQTNLTQENYNILYGEKEKQFKDTLDKIVQEGKVESKEITTPTGQALYYITSVSPITVKKQRNNKIQDVYNGYIEGIMTLDDKNMVSY